MAKQKLKKYIDKYERILMAAAIFTVVIFIAESYLNPPHNIYLALEIISWTIWVLFAAELAIKWHIDENSTPVFIKQNIFAILILALPLIRAFRFVKIAKANKLIYHIETASTAKDLKKLANLRKLFQI